MKSFNFQTNNLDNSATLWSMWGPRLYHKLESDGKGRKTIKAQHLWFRILEAQMETGTPYMLYKDHCNRKSNQQNLGILSSKKLYGSKKLGSKPTGDFLISKFFNPGIHENEQLWIAFRKMMEDENDGLLLFLKLFCFLFCFVSWIF